MKKILPIVFGMIVILGVFYFINKKEAVAPVVPPVTTNDVAVSPVTTNTAELCFAKFGTPDKYGSYDKYTLRLILNGEKVTGELNLLPAEKDSKTGEIEGTVSAVDKVMMARTADLWWFSFAEGMNVKEQLKIIFGEGTASVGFGEMVDRGDGVYVYKDSKNISYSLNLTDVSCLDLTERASVESYLKENISKLSPVKAVLGGTWYVVSNTVNLEKNSGTVVYEDGHIQETKNFSYTTNEKGEVVNLTIH
jgi:hypothetical protein